MKFLKFLFFSLFLIPSTYATHNMAGMITYKHISGFTYEVTITTYTETSGSSLSADRYELEIHWGDGNSEIIERDSFRSIINTSIQENKYTSLHTYSSTGTYTVSMTDPNRNESIINIYGGISENTPFHIESTIAISPNSSFSNSSVDYLAPPILYTEVNEPFSYNLSASDPDGDVLTYELVTPKEGLLTDISTYIIPDSSAINIINGEFTWNSPQAVGNYAFSVMVREYRNGIFVGATLVDFQLIVGPAITNGLFVGYTPWDTDSNGNLSFTVSPNDSVNLTLSYIDSNTNKSTATIDLFTYSETLSKGATASSQTISLYEEVETFTWVPNTSHLRCAPYIVTFRGVTYFNESISKDLTVMIWVRDQSNTNACNQEVWQVTPTNKIQQDASVTIFPNPFDKQITLAIPESIIQEELQFVLWNSLGQQIRIENIQKTNQTIELKTLNKGYYFYQLLAKDGLISSGKLIHE
ncbi:MAG: T9SS type A sorting domain-containing protein [Saprospiraceae bacterium]|nr:T9SS type A sorting domain-containing protein [Saprospiraceae bacterium]